MKKIFTAVIFAAASLMMGAELKMEGDFIRFSPQGRMGILPYNQGMITFHEGKKASPASFYLDMETKHPKRYFGQRTTAVSKPTFQKVNSNEWLAGNKIPVNAKENINLSMKIKMTPLNTLDVEYEWDAPKQPSDIISRGITINYKTFDRKDAAIVVSGKKTLLPNKKVNGILANKQESPDVILFPGTPMEVKFALEGKYTIYYYTNVNRLTIIRVIALNQENQLRFSIIPK